MKKLPGVELNGVFRFVVRFVSVGFGGPGGGFEGLPVDSKSSGKAATATTKQKAAKTATGTTQSNKNKMNNTV